MTKFLVSIALIALLTACGPSTSSLVKDEGMQDLALTVAVARVIEATDDPQTTAKAILTMLEASDSIETSVLSDSVAGWFGDDLPASEKVLLDSILEAIEEDATAYTGDLVGPPKASPRVIKSLEAAATAVYKG
jgi:hypothetical protein